MQGKGLATKSPAGGASALYCAEPGPGIPDRSLGDAPQELHSQTVGPTGPVCCKTRYFMKNTGTVRTQPPRDRVVHTKGYGATGYSRPTGRWRNTPSCTFTEPGGKTPVATRFFPGGEQQRHPGYLPGMCGVFRKFYTSCGVFDLLCNPHPCVSGAGCHSVPRGRSCPFRPRRSTASSTNRFWEFVARTPESTHFITWFVLRYGYGKEPAAYPWQQRQHLCVVQ